MNNATQDRASKVCDAAVTFRLPACANAAVIDAGKVRLGGLGPVFRAVTIVDTGKVRLGGLSPAIRRASIVDTGRVRLGGLGPLFR